MPSVRYLKHKGLARAKTPKSVPLFPDAEPFILIPRCQALVVNRQCKMEATRMVEGVLVFCGTHHNVSRGR